MATSGLVTNAFGLAYSPYLGEINFVDLTASGIKLKKAPFIISSGGLRTIGGGGGGGVANGALSTSKFSTTGQPAVILFASLSSWLVSDPGNHSIRLITFSGE